MWRSRLPGLAVGFGLIVAAGGGAVMVPAGISSAHASEFYSRRRVNGVWITGQFSKAEVDGDLRRRGVGSKPEPRVRRSVWSRNAARPRRIGWARARFQSLGGQAPAGDFTPDAAIAAFVAAAPLAALPLVAVPTRAGPTVPAQAALPASQAALADPARAEGAPEADAHREHLRRALEAKAQELATLIRGGDREPPAPRPEADEAPAELQPLSSTYDYRTQVRTTVYQNGVVIRETLASPTGPAIVTRRFVGMDTPRQAGDAAPTAR